jgi:hypothetical protein
VSKINLWVSLFLKSRFRFFLPTRMKNPSMEDDGLLSLPKTTFFSGMLLTFLKSSFSFSFWVGDLPICSTF